MMRAQVSRSGEMADALRSGRSPRKGVEVQVLSSAPFVCEHSICFFIKCGMVVVFCGFYCIIIGVTFSLL